MKTFKSLDELVKDIKDAQLETANREARELVARIKGFGFDPQAVFINALNEAGIGGSNEAAEQHC